MLIFCFPFFPKEYASKTVCVADGAKPFFYRHFLHFFLHFFASQKKSVKKCFLSHRKNEEKKVSKVSVS
jgi:hypothetical protein